MRKKIRDLNAMHGRSLHAMTMHHRHWVALLLMLLSFLPSHAFRGSRMEAGREYYLFNIYQAKFLGSDGTLQAPNVGTPACFLAGEEGFVIGGIAYKARWNDAGYYQLVDGDRYLALEEKVPDPLFPRDENRAMYPGGGVTCLPTPHDTDRSYWLLIDRQEYREWTEKKKFTIASLNVDGLPRDLKVLGLFKIKLNPDAMEKLGAQAIGQRLRSSGYDVVGVSEDLNFHKYILKEAQAQPVSYGAMTHRGKVGVNVRSVARIAVKKSPLFHTDGLGLFYRKDRVDEQELIRSESWTAWERHNGYTDQGADGLIAKGFRFYVVRLDDGTEIDLYTMHMDAGGGRGDYESRASQLAQLARAIKATDHKRPIVIIGDSNCRYTRDNIKGILVDALSADSRFTVGDAWIELARQGRYPRNPSGSLMTWDRGYRQGEVVDKIWYVNHSESPVQIKAETYAQDLSFVASEDIPGTLIRRGAPLCDHKPCVVTFSYTVRP